MIYMMIETVIYSLELILVKEMAGWPGYWESLPLLHYATNRVGPLLAPAGTGCGVCVLFWSMATRGATVRKVRFLFCRGNLSNKMHEFGSFAVTYCWPIACAIFCTSAHSVTYIFGIPTLLACNRFPSYRLAVQNFFDIYGKADMFFRK